MTHDTFGSTRAAAILADILTKRNDPKLSRSISNLLISYFKGMKELDAIQDKKVHTVTIKLWADTYSEKTFRYDNEVGRFTRNLISTEYKLKLKSKSKSIMTRTNKQFRDCQMMMNVAIILVRRGEYEALRLYPEYSDFIAESKGKTYEEIKKVIFPE